MDEMEMETYSKAHLDRGFECCKGICGAVRDLAL